MKPIPFMIGVILGMVALSVIIEKLEVDESTDDSTGTKLTRTEDQATDGYTETFRVTAYDAGECCCGRWADGTFADGSPVGGPAVAAPRDIPFGIKIRIPGYGVATVRDRGGAITKGRLDVYFDTHQQALIWGVQELECEVLE